MSFNLVVSCRQYKDRLYIEKVHQKRKIGKSCRRVRKTDKSDLSRKSSQ